MTETTASTELSADRADLLAIIERQRGFFRQTLTGLTDDQARLTPTASELSLGGLVKHVASTEDGWLDFIERGPEAMSAPGGEEIDWSNPSPEVYEAFANGFRLLPEETLAGVLAEYDRVAARAEHLIRTADLELSHDLPPAPWFEPGARWSVRRVFLHLLSETAQHSGHADILRESIDGQKTMAG